MLVIIDFPDKIEYNILLNINNYHLLEKTMQNSENSPKKEETLETAMTHEVKTLYYSTMRNNFMFHEKAYLDMEWFKKHFATVAHRHGFVFHSGKSVLNDSQRADRRAYNLYFEVVRNRLSAAIKRLQSNQAENKRQQAEKVLARQADGTKTQVRTVQPVQLSLSADDTPSHPSLSPPHSFVEWHKRFKATHAK